MVVIPQNEDLDVDSLTLTVWKENCLLQFDVALVDGMWSVSKKNSVLIYHYFEKCRPPYVTAYLFSERNWLTEALLYIEDDISESKIHFSNNYVHNFFAQSPYLILLT